MTAMVAVLSSVFPGFVQSGAAVSIAASAVRMAKVGLCGIAAAILVTASVACGLASLWIWEVPRLGPAGAPLAVAGILLIGGLAALALIRHAMRDQRGPSRSPELLLA